MRRVPLQDAFFVLAEVDIGMAADVGGLQRFPKIVGPVRAGIQDPAVPPCASLRSLSVIKFNYTPQGMTRWCASSRCRRDACTPTRRCALGLSRASAPIEPLSSRKVNSCNGCVCVSVRLCPCLCLCVCVRARACLRAWVRACVRARAHARGRAALVFVCSSFCSASQLAVMIASKSPLATFSIKTLLNYTRDHSVSDSLEYAITWNAAMLQTPDMSAAALAKMAKRQATFPNLPDVRAKL